MCRSAARVIRIVPVSVTSSTENHCSSVISASVAVPPRPALFKSTSGCGRKGEREGSSSWLLRQPQGLLAEHIALDLVRAAVDGVGARVEEETGQAVVAVFGGDRLRAEHVDRELAQAAVERRPQQLV